MCVYGCVCVCAYGCVRMGVYVCVYGCVCMCAYECACVCVVVNRFIHKNPIFKKLFGCDIYIYIILMLWRHP